MRTLPLAGLFLLSACAKQVGESEVSAAEQERILATQEQENSMPAQDQGSATPTHEQVRYAVALQAHPEFTAWTENPDNYTLMLAETVDLKTRRLFFVAPHHLRHPMSFYAAFDEDGNGRVTTHNPAAVGALLAEDPSLSESEALPEAIAELIRSHHRSLAVVRSAEALPPEQQALFSAPQRDGDLLRFQVKPDGRAPEAWTFALRGEDSQLDRVPLGTTP